MKFTPRLTAPSKDDKRFINYQYGGWSIAIPIDKTTGRTIPNCAGYAHGRLLEILGKTSVDWKIPASNGEDFMDKAKENGMATGMTPKLGAAVCWVAGKKHNSADGYGHVAVVEQIFDNGDILVSQSGLNGTEFYTTRLTKSSGYTYRDDRPLDGFIYCGLEFDSNIVSAPTPTNGNIAAGKKVHLSSTPCYTSEITPNAYGHKSGDYYLWDAEVRNNRIRITNSPARVGVAGQVTCWVPIGALGLSQSNSSNASSSVPEISAGRKVQLNNAAVYSSETGASIGRRTGTYYTWDSTVINGRIRMTNSPERVGVAGQVSFWASIADIQ